MNHRRTTALTAVLASATILVAAGCNPATSAHPTDPTTSAPTNTDGTVDAEARADELGIDPESYYLAYEEGGDDMMSAGPSAGAPDMATEGGAAPSPGSAGRSSETPVGPPHVPPAPGPTEENTFADVGETGFVPTATDSTSTFALDIDTGSYSVAQRFAAEGYRPPVDSIRTEEWINAFDYGYEAPTDDDLAVSVESGVAPHTQDGTRLVRVGVQTKQLAPAERPPANITFVIDTSGSMDIRERLGLVKSSLALLVLNLRPDDTISIVTYGDEAQAMLEPTSVRDAETIVDAIESLEPGGSTNMAAGLRTGYRAAREAYVEGAVNTVVLASDGVANVGVSDAQGLTKLIQRQGQRGISLVTVGYGMGNYNDEIMEQLADNGDGFYSYVDTYEEAERLFVDELTPTLTVVARDAKSQVRFDPEVVESYRLIGYENREIADEDFRNDTVDAGELGAGHTATALYEVELRDPDTTSAAIGEVSVRWESAATGKVEERTAPIDVGGPDADNSPTLDLAATVAYSAEVLRENATVSGRQVTVEQLIDDATRLAAAGVEELVDYLTTVQPLPKADDHD